MHVTINNECYRLFLEHLMDTKLVVIPEFRSHLETMKHIRPEEFKKQVFQQINLAMLFDSL